ncbi:unnamed protein product [Paramecium sonneborni]|uniref:C2 domain-containing protein n=1 Tax=Paramecium sonneborni TaxID=65129 RepID=A0A8S1KI44_9CILI|nr:unnamed protein product [Paramecium sonneborni]
MSQSKFFVVRIKCYELVQNQNNSEINCMVVVKEYADNQWNEKGKTEIQKNQRNPQFSTAIQLNYQFEMSYRVLFQVLNTNKEQSNWIDRTKYINSVNCKRLNIFYRYYKLRQESWKNRNNWRILEIQK